MKVQTTFSTHAALKLGKQSFNGFIKSCLAALFLLALIPFSASAQVPVAYYDFEDDLNRNTVSEVTSDMSFPGVNPVSVTKGGGDPITGVDGAGRTNYNGGGSANSGMAISSTNWSVATSQPAANAVTQYYQFSANTSGLKDIVVSMDIKRDNNGPDFCAFLYSIDGGTTFLDKSWISGTNKNINSNFENVQADFTGITTVDNNTNVIFRVFGFKAKNASGSLIIDNLTIGAKTITAGSVTLLVESEIYTAVTGGGTGAVLNRPSFTISGTGTEVTLGSNLAISSAMVVATGATLNFGTGVNRISGTGTFTLQSGATIEINSPQGISTTAGQGNIQVTGTKTYNAGANYVYEPNAAGTLVTGNALPATITGNLILSPGPATTNPIEFTQATTLSGINNQVIGSVEIGVGRTLSIGTGGRLIFGSDNTALITGAGNFTLQSGATIDITSPQGISTVAGQGNVQVTGTKSFNSGAIYNYLINSAGPLTTGNALPAVVSGNLNVNLGPLTDNPLTLNQSTTVSGTLTNNSGELAVGSGNTLTINGGLVLDGGSLSVGAASLALNGPAITGSTAQSGLQTTTTSNLAIGGSAAGLVLPANVTQLQDFMINNTNGVSLDNNLEIDGELNLASGNLRTGGTKKVRIKSTGRLAGGSTTSYVEGPISYINDGTAANTLVFPIGKNNEYRPVTLTLTQDQAIATEYTAEQIEGSHGQLTIPTDELQNVSGIRYFSLSKGAGADVTSGTITLTYGTDDDVLDPLNLRIAQTNADNTGWVNLGRAGSSSTTNTGTITSSFLNLPAVSDFLIANAKGGNNPLPVELATFNAVKKGAAVHLDWTTASETNNKGFEVQVSQNKGEFRNLGFVASKNSNSSAVQTYSFTDYEYGKQGTRYYRLMQTDLDGTVSYSPLKAVTFGNAETGVAVYPNPFKRHLTIEVTAVAEQAATIEITDALGKVINVQEVDLTIGSNQATVELPSTLALGVYTLALKTSEGVEYQKIIRK